MPHPILFYRKSWIRYHTCWTGSWLLPEQKNKMTLHKLHRNHLFKAMHWLHTLLMIRFVHVMEDCIVTLHGLIIVLSVTVYISNNYVNYKYRRFVDLWWRNCLQHSKLDQLRKSRKCLRRQMFPQQFAVRYINSYKLKYTSYKYQFQLYNLDQL